MKDESTPESPETASADAPPDEVAAIVDQVFEDFAELLPPELAADVRELVNDALSTHPLGARLAERVRPREGGDRSGEQMAPGVEPSADESPRDRASGDDQ